MSGEMKDRVKQLERERDMLLKELKDLDRSLKEGEIGEEEYKERRHTVERGLVEVIDRLIQMGFIMGEK
jgi:phage-related minor tail protein